MPRLTNTKIAKKKAKAAKRAPKKAKPSDARVTAAFNRAVNP